MTAPTGRCEADHLRSAGCKSHSFRKSQLKSGSVQRPPAQAVPRELCSMGLDQSSSRAEHAACGVHSARSLAQSCPTPLLHILRIDHALKKYHDLVLCASEPWSEKPKELLLFVCVALSERGR